MSALQSQSFTVTEIPYDSTISVENPVVLCDASRGVVYVRLPASPKEGDIIDFLKIDKTRNPCVVKANGKPVEKPSMLTIIRSDAPLQLRFVQGIWRKR